MLSEIEQLIYVGKFNEARQTLESFEKKNDVSFSNHITGQLLKSKLLIKMGEYNQALRLAETAVATSRNLETPLLEVNSLITMAEALENLGKLEECLNAIDRAEKKLFLEKFLNAIDRAEKKPAQLSEPTSASLSMMKANVIFRKAKALWRKGDIDLALDLFTASLDLCQQIGNEQAIAHSLNSIGTIYWQKGQLDQALDYFKQSFKLRQKIGNKQDIANSLNNIGSICYRKGDFNLALEYYQSALSLQKQVGNRLDISKSLNNIGLVSQQKGDLDQALDYFRESLGLREELGNKQDIAICFNNIGVIYRDKGELNSALECYLQSLALNEEVGSHRDIAYALNNIGDIFAKKGEFDRALESYKRSLTLRKKLGNKQDIANSLNAIGHVYYFKGELTIALEYYEQSLALREEIGNEYYIILSLINIGTIYQQKGELRYALARLKHCLSLCEEMGNNLLTAMTLFELVSLALDMDSQDQARLYHEQLRLISEQAHNRLISQQCQVAEALILKTSTRLRDLAKAEELFDQFLRQETSDHQLTVVALLNLCDLLITELHSSSDPDVLKEVQSLVTRLSEIAAEQHSHWLLAETYVLRSKLALVELDLHGAQRFLSQAQRLAEKWGLSKLAIKVSNDYDSLLVQLSHWEELVASNASLLERLKLVDLEDIFRRMLRKHTVDAPQLPPENPVMVLILSENGICLFSRVFVQEGQFEEQLVGAFVTAITRLGTNIFEDSEAIDRIVYQEHTLAVKRLESLVFIYAFKGQSYTALKKIGQFMTALQESSSAWNALQRVLKTSKALLSSEDQEISAILNNVFFS